MARLPRLSLPGIPQHIIQTYSRSGTLWEGRYKSTLVESEKYFLTVSRYIELNPVRAASFAFTARRGQKVSAV